MSRSFRFICTLIIACILWHSFTHAGHFPEPTPTNTASFFFGDFKINGVDARVGDEVAFFDPQGVLCGLYVVRVPGKYGRVPVYGDDPSTQSIDEGAKAGDVLTVKIWDSSTGTELEGPELSLTKGFYGGSSTPSLIPPEWQGDTDFALNIDTSTHFPRPDPSLYSGSVDFWGNLTIKGREPKPGDEIGVFDGDGNVIGHFLFTKKGNTYGFMHVYGSQSAISGKPLTFKVWEKSTSTEYPMSSIILRQGTATGSSLPSPLPPVYTDNGRYALDIEVPLESINQFILTLNTGWNFISIPIEPIDTSIGLVLKDISPNVNIVWSYKNETKTWLKYKPGMENPTLTSFEPGRGYWVYMKDDATLTVIGRDTSGKILLYEGWNLVGYSGIDNAGIETKVEGLTDRWTIIWNWTNNVWKHIKRDTPSILTPSIFTPTLLSKFTRGKAYWIKITQGSGVIEWQQ
ncbi:MAG: hypothetical protein N2745_11610 [Syntrophorhabdaceae bacterium]|nr:hypothetical protein [Syntrophorhabdaceae bacterium]